VNPIDRALWFGLTGRGVARWDGRAWQAWRAYGRDQVGAALAVTSPQRTGELNLAVDLAGYRSAFPAERALARLGWDDPVIYSLYEPVAVAGGVQVRVFPAPEASYPVGAPVYTVDRGPAGDQVTSLAVAPDGRLWLGARAGLARRPNPDWGETECDEQPATAAPDCRWDGGLSAFDGRAWTSWAPAVGGLPSREIQAVAVDRRGQVWAGTGGAFGEAGRGVAVLDPITGAFTLHSRASGGAGFGFDSVTGVAVDGATGQVWLSSQGKPSCPAAAGKKDDCPPIAGAVSRWDGQAWQSWSRRAAPPSPALADQGGMTALTFDGQRGQLWAGGWEGEQNFHWNDGTGLNASVDVCSRDCLPTAWSGQRWPGEGAVFALAVDGAGRLWTGGHRNGRGAVPPVGGLRLRTGTQWTVHTTAVAPLPSDDITALAAGGAAMWVGTWDRGATQWVAPNLDQRVFLPGAHR
jgi:sugar lactone lactonase YvrE